VTRRLEPVLFGLFLACWVVDLLVYLRIVTVAGTLDLSFYALYSTAVWLGWVSGFLYMRRRDDVSAAWHRRLFLIYFLSPPGLLYLLRAMAPLPVQRAAPLVGLYAVCVYAIFFWVPIKFPINRRRL
jgi:hypothetical protein